MVDNRYEISKCLKHFDRYSRDKQEKIQPFIEQFLNKKISSDSFYAYLLENKLLIPELRLLQIGTPNTGEVIGSDDELRKILRDVIIENKIPSLMQINNLNY
jgi:hypothetical protein